MPDINGLGVLRAIRDIAPTCKVILMTGDSTVDTAIEAVKLGALDYISKPFDLERLGGLLTGVRKSIDAPGARRTGDAAGRHRIRRSGDRRNVERGLPDERAAHAGRRRASRSGWQ
jgi:DNA-binding NtrC family response regulator